MFFKSNLTLLLISIFAISTLAVLAPGDRAIFLPKDELGFYFEDNIGNKTHPNIVRLLPSLSSDASYFFGNCAGLKPYDCSACIKSPYQTKIDITELPLIIKANDFYNQYSEASTKFWSLNSKVFNGTCETDSINFEQKRAGVVGMGYNFNYVPFDLPKAFSFLVNKEQTKAALFYRDPPSAERTPLFTWKAGNNWRAATNGKMTNPSKSDVKADISFNLNSDALGFDSYFYPTAFEAITKFMGCQGANQTDWKPKCPFKGEVENLPALEFEFNAGKVKIPPQAYVDSVDEGVATLNIKKISLSMAGTHFSHTDYRRTSIMFDTKFLSLYEVVFDMSDRSQFEIKVYTLYGTTLSVDDAKEEVPEPPKKEEEPKKEEPKKEEPKKEEEKKEPPKNTDQEGVQSSSFSLGSFFSGLVLAFVLSGAVFGYLRFRDNKKNEYASLNESTTHMHL